MIPASFGIVVQVPAAEKDLARQALELPRVVAVKHPYQHVCRLVARAAHDQPHVEKKLRCLVGDQQHPNGTVIAVNGPRRGREPHHPRRVQMMQAPHQVLFG